MEQHSLLAEHGYDIALGLIILCQIVLTWLSNRNFRWDHERRITKIEQQIKNFGSCVDHESRISTIEGRLNKRK